LESNFQKTIFRETYGALITQIPSYIFMLYLMSTGPLP
jgi:hypothetical protein